MNIKEYICPLCGYEVCSEIVTEQKDYLIRKHTYKESRQNTIEECCNIIDLFAGYLDDDMIYRIKLKLRELDSK